MSCSKCKNRLEYSGNCHIGCVNPVKGVLLAKRGGDAMRVIAEKTVKICSEKGLNVVVLNPWNGSGLFPACFDEGIVYACANFEEGEAPGPGEHNQFLRIALALKNGGVPVMGAIQ